MTKAAPSSSARAVCPQPRLDLRDRQQVVLHAPRPGTRPGRAGRRGWPRPAGAGRTPSDTARLSLRSFAAPVDEAGQQLLEAGGDLVRAHLLAAAAAPGRARAGARPGDPSASTSAWRPTVERSMPWASSTAAASASASGMRQPAELQVGARPARAQSDRRRTSCPGW